MDRRRAAITVAGVLFVLSGCGSGVVSGIGRDSASAVVADGVRTPDGRIVSPVAATPAPNPIAFTIDCTTCTGDGSAAHPFVVPFRSQNVNLTATDAHPSVGFSVASASDNHDHACLRLDPDPSNPFGSGTVKYRIDTLGFYDCTPDEIASFTFQDTPKSGPSVTRTVYVATSSGQPTPPPSVFPANCPPKAPEFGDGTCPAAELHIIAGIAVKDLDASDERAVSHFRPEPNDFALLFAADGTFLAAEQHLHWVPNVAYAIGVRVTHPEVVDPATLVKYQWTIEGGRYNFHDVFNPAFTQPWAVQLISVEHVTGSSAPLTGGSFLADDGDGKLLAFGDNLLSPATFTVPPGTERPVTVLNLPQTPQSHCGNCWLTLLH